VKGWKKILHTNRDQNKAGVAILLSDKMDFKTKAVKRDKEGHYIMIIGSIQEEDITIINIYAPNIGALQYVRQMLTSMKGEINNNTIITPVLLKQGLVLSPPYRQTAIGQRQVKSRQESLKRESVAKARLFHQTLKEKRPWV